MFTVCMGGSWRARADRTRRDGATPESTQMMASAFETRFGARIALHSNAKASSGRELDCSVLQGAIRIERAVDRRCETKLESCGPIPRAPGTCSVFRAATNAF